MSTTIRDLRTKRNLSQSELATAINAKQSTISDIERGAKRPSIAMAIRLAKFFGVTLDELLIPVEATPCQN